MDDPLENTPPEWMKELDNIFLLIYVIEALLKIFALGY